MLCLCIYVRTNLPRIREEEKSKIKRGKGKQHPQGKRTDSEYYQSVNMGADQIALKTRDEDFLT